MAAPRGPGRPHDIGLPDTDRGGAGHRVLVALFVGGEGRGLAPAVIENADHHVTIPMRAPVESLNTAVTAALLVYEARRQRLEAPGPTGS